MFSALEIFLVMRYINLLFTYYYLLTFEYDMMCARVYRVKCFNFSNIRICICIRTDLYIKIRIRRMRILINFVTSLTSIILLAGF